MNALNLAPTSNLRELAPRLPHGKVWACAACDSELDPPGADPTAYCRMCEETVEAVAVDPEHVRAYGTADWQHSLAVQAARRANEAVANVCADMLRRAKA